MKKILWAALAAVAMFVTSCEPAVEYETLTKDYNNSWKVSAVVPKGVYRQIFDFLYKNRLYLLLSYFIFITKRFYR